MIQSQLDDSETQRAVLAAQVESLQMNGVSSRVGVGSAVSAIGAAMQRITMGARIDIHESSVSPPPAGAPVSAPGSWMCMRLDVHEAACA